jgi:hypothetical protein
LKDFKIFFPNELFIEFKLILNQEEERFRENLHLDDLFSRILSEKALCSISKENTNEEKDLS